MEYLYEISISHNWGKIKEQWLKEVFPPLFEEYLNTKLPHQPDKLLDNSVYPSRVNLSFVSHKAADFVNSNYSSTQQAAPCIKNAHGTQNRYPSH